MKFIHLSDLHLGKSVNKFSMIEDQKFILNSILALADQEKPDAVFIAGDVYDRPTPSTEAVTLLNDFLEQLADRGLQVFLISGNHDSPERLAFGNKLIEKSGVHIAPVYSGQVKPITITDAYGSVNVFLLPYIKPAHVRLFYPDETIETYTDALRLAIGNMNIDPSQRNILVTHQFIVSAVLSGSEEATIGGVDSVDASVFADFDYTALGHLHRAQSCTFETIRYCGTPLKYSLSEMNDTKSITIVDFNEKGSVVVRTADLVPEHEMREIKGSFKDISSEDFYNNTTYPEDYVHIILTDEDDVPEAFNILRNIYGRLMKLDYDNTRTRTNQTITMDGNIEKRQPIELFADFFEKQHNQPMSDQQREYVQNLINTIWG
ncbi:MAG: exonuclease SbcCD subunit D, partial [Thermoguttaceae bacterium]|nr:exonuclease SbcCD subunit D [Thermoguttaceae bacterium]